MFARIQHRPFSSSCSNPPLSASALHPRLLLIPPQLPDPNILRHSQEAHDLAPDDNSILDRLEHAVPHDGRAHGDDGRPEHQPEHHARREQHEAPDPAEDDPRSGEQRDKRGEGGEARRRRQEGERLVDQGRQEDVGDVEGLLELDGGVALEDLDGRVRVEGGRVEKVERLGGEEAFEEG
ncbi:hypothetical protein BN1708_000717 [Verticillium longisporum]|uniref:Uncharacterized protein n=1 Tax=Verticillium longisporum TaxID=100787 RepID=A0A0G4LY12_VERLO|nr:hypothetical protein BN1708_000717 [Verticillium longisporum]